MCLLLAICQPDGGRRASCASKQSLRNRGGRMAPAPGWQTERGDLYLDRIKVVHGTFSCWSVQFEDGQNWDW
ncbi:hypothetical protein C7S18_02890 [Ahniella affigens]|uniref:Uncharacterized protein n=1 Tax=Ahniella affigens TaxID=2021234 RepID=A0A2P1PMY8_9GAMM|nr:hypothetical protein C7S18_02890 [Ahniella affigens]